MDLNRNRKRFYIKLSCSKCCPYVNRSDTPYYQFIFRKDISLSVSLRHLPLGKFFLVR